MSQVGLPKGWVKCQLKDIISVNPKVIANDEDLSGFIPMSHAPVSFFDTFKYDERNWGEIKKKYTNFADGDVIFAKVTPCFENGKAALLEGLPNGIGAGSSEFYVLRPLSSTILSKYVFSIIKSAEFLTNGERSMTGAVGLRRVPRSFVENFEINLPPLDEQQVIADKLDTLLAQVESIKARLERIPEILKQFRQSLLAAAVSGKLTEEWDVQDCLLSDVVEFQNGYAFKSEWFSDAGAYQVIKLGNIRDGRLFLENAPAYVDRKIWQEFERFKPNVGDTLISMTGTRFKQDYGFGCLVETDQDILINQRVGRLIPLREKITPEFLNLFIRSEQFRRQFFQGETGGVNQGNVGSKHIMSLSIKVPRIEIQIEVVNKVIKALNAVTVIERQAELALERVNNLTQSILAKAFRGELTAEWREANPELISGDNSAEALLGRIKVERELAKPATKRGRGKA